MKSKPVDKLQRSVGGLVLASMTEGGGSKLGEQGLSEARNESRANEPVSFEGAN